MKKSVISLLLAATMAVSLLPTGAAAESANANFSGANVTWIGTQTEFQQTLENMFVGGMRKIKVGDKWGMVDATGEWVAPPIYEEIELHYLVQMEGAIALRPAVVNSESLEAQFMDGYTQCVRNGKMGLLNQYGEEVIPAQYDAVGLPSEGMCRIIKHVGNKAYLGYWNLALGREIVAPNKYVVSGANATAEGSQMVHKMLDTSSALMGLGGLHTEGSGSMMIDYQEVMLPSGGRLAAQCDYTDGYVFVSTGEFAKEGQYVTSAFSGGGAVAYGTILDKNGKEVLPGGPYPYRVGSYPQFGPYMVFVQQSNKVYTSDHGDLGKPYLSGVVGPEGVVIPAQYTGGVRSPIEGWYVGDARMTVIPELKLVITAKDTKPGKEDGGKVGVVNFKNQTVIPFTHDFNFFTYNAANKVFAGLGEGGVRLYTAAGKRLNDKSYFEIGFESSYDMVNGFAEVKSDAQTTGFLNLKTGADFYPAMVEDVYRTNSDFSVNGLVWVRNPDKKWGLLDATGKVILPYQYDAVRWGDEWNRAQNGYAIVNIGQKQGIVTAAGVPLVPCEYDKLYSASTYGPVHEEYVTATKNGKMGLLSLVTGKLVIPTSYADIGGMYANSARDDYFSLGANVVKVGEKAYCLVDKNGNKIPGTDYDIIYSPTRGLFRTQDNAFIGAEGKIVFPDTLSYPGSPEMTLVVRDGKVGYINPAKLAQPTQPKAANPLNATAVPSSMNLLVNGKSVAVEAYAIGGNNYIKVRDMAYFLNGTNRNFGVAWNNAKGAVELRSNAPYATVAGDMAKGDGKSKAASRSGNAIYVDGVRRKLTAYTIGGNNFFKLRDVMRTFDVYVGYDNGTVTVDTSKGYELTDAERGGRIAPSTTVDAPPASQVNKIEVLKAPNLEFYLTGNHTFRPDGFELRYWDEQGVPHIVTDTNEMTFTVGSQVIEDGYVFKTSSMKEGTISYKGISTPMRFPVYQGTTVANPDVVPGQTDNGIAEGKYTISCLGNYFAMSNGWMVLSQAAPHTVFSVKKVDDGYILYLEGLTENAYVSVSVVNSQLVAQTSVEKFATKFKITHLGGDTYSVREYGKPHMVVNASGQQSKDGTPVIVYKHLETPKNAILTFTAAN